MDRTRWRVIAAGVLANLCSGSAYAFSVYSGPLRRHLGCSETAISLAFSLSIAFLPAGMLISGRIADRRSPGLVVAAGGAIFGAGMFLASFSTTAAWLYATYGVMMSVGNGATYGAVVAASVKWFPDRKGLASGTVVSALGLGTLIIAPLAQKMIEAPGIGIFGAFKILGTAFVAVNLVASRFIVKPPAGYVPASFEPGAGGGDASANELGWTRMLARPRFWLLYALYVLGTFSGLMIASQAANIAKEVTGLAGTAASLVVSALGLANSSGRLIWGAVSDRIGREEALALMFLTTTAVMFAFPGFASSAPLLVAAVILVGLCYGGYLGIFPSLCSDSFGSRNLTVNYGVLFTAFSLAGILGPHVGASLKRSTGGYAAGFEVGGAVALCGMILALAGKLVGRRRAGDQRLDPSSP